VTAAWAAAACFAAALTLLTAGALGARRRHRVLARLPGRRRSGPARRRPAGLMARLGRVFPVPAADGELRRRLRLAGFPATEAPAVFRGLRLAAAAVAALLGAGLGTAIGWPMVAAMGAAAAGAAGWSLPTALLGGLARRRERAIRADLPLFVDVVAVMLGGGASVYRVLTEFGQDGTDLAPSFVEATTRLRRDLAGGMSFGRALERWADSLAIEEVREIAAMMRDAVEGGGEISGRLEAYSSYAIERRLLDARQRAGRRSTQLAVAMMVFFLPPLILLLAAPSATALVRTLIRLTQAG